ncbi:MAG: Hint domain-containing protein [Rhodospirillales bacterium]|nr:Hint domain-containing protein [Rhodospirillales bacterium]
MPAAPPPSLPDCFCAGTKLMTLRGEVPVERLAPGEYALTLSGQGAALKQVTRIDVMEVDLGTRPEAAPVRITAGAVAPGMPARDLLVSPGHAIALPDESEARVLIPALYLVNGATIRRAPATGTQRYFAVALDSHDLLMADGQACESDPPGDADAAFTSAGRAAAGCAPCLWGSAAEPFHARLLERAGELGHRLAENPALELRCNGDILEALSETPTERVYLLPPGARQVDLLSRSTIPAETRSGSTDRRRLGVPITALLHDGLALPLDGPAFAAGFLPPERDGAAAWRWTTGAATLDLPAHDFEVTLELHTHAGWERYWDASPA